MPDYCDTRGAYAIGHRMTERKRETGKTCKLSQGNLAMGTDEGDHSCILFVCLHCRIIPIF